MTWISFDLGLFAHVTPLCRVTVEIWAFLLTFFSIVWAIHISVSSFQHGQNQRQTHRLSILCFTQYIWMDRNCQSSEGVEIIHRLKSNVLAFLLRWVTGRVNSSLAGFVDFVMNSFGIQFFFLRGVKLAFYTCVHRLCPLLAPFSDLFLTK